MRCFQYKILNNILFLNKQLAAWGLCDSALSLFCRNENETEIHIFSECDAMQSLWTPLKIYLENKIELPALDIQSRIFGFTNIDHDKASIVNHLLLIFKLYIYNSRVSGRLNLNCLLEEIRKIKSLEKHISEKNEIKKKLFLKKWKVIDEFLDKTI